MYVSYKMIHTEASSKCWPLFHCCTVSYLRNARDGASIIKVTWFALTTNNHTAICVLLFLPKIIPGTCPSLRKSHFPSIHSERYLSVRTFSISSSFSIQACILWQLFWKYKKTKHNITKKHQTKKFLSFPFHWWTSGICPFSSWAFVFNTFGIVLWIWKIHVRPYIQH